eukprot:gene30629-14481_t
MVLWARKDYVHSYRHAHYTIAYSNILFAVDMGTAVMVVGDVVLDIYACAQSF